MPQYPALIQLSSLDGTNGFKINGVAADDTSGISVASAGDINGDGFSDLIIGAWGADPNGSGSGAAYVVFGKAGGFTDPLNLSALDGTNGFKLNGEATADGAGRWVGSAGDINNDGFDDLIVSGHRNSNTGMYSGASYVVYGKAAGFAGTLNLSALDGSNGFKINGEAAGDRFGRSGVSAGDVNGDGFDDLIIGGYQADPNGNSNSGATYVVFGKAAAFSDPFNITALDGSNGFKLNGEAVEDRSGSVVASAGDVNGDGFADIIIGAPMADPNGNYSGASYVVFGKAGGFTSSFNLSALDGTNGFKINGEAANNRAGSSVASAGDINGDGFADIIIGANPGAASYVVFGKASGFADPLNLSSLDGTAGFKISGTVQSVASAGDINGDGFDDLLIGRDYADPNGNSNSGASHVVFGKASGFNNALDLDALDGNDGFTIAGEAADDRSGFSAKSAGDVNGDGLADLIIGAINADPNGSSSGASYVVLGRLPDAAVNRTGTGASQTLVGGDFNDVLSGLGGKDTLWGHGGSDLLDGGAGADTMRGGAGDDTYVVDSLSDVVIETAGNGTDTVQTTLVDFSLAALTEIENLIGNAFANALTGNAKDNVLDGGAGADTLVGGLGNDTYIIDDAGDAFIESAGAGTDTIVTSLASFSLAALSNFEDLTGASSAGQKLTGNAAANRLTGGAGNDTLDGGVGSDTMLGGSGNDTYVVDSSGDVLSDTSGTDTVRASVTRTLASGFEKLILTGSKNINGTGSSSANTITGNSHVNKLDGKAGNDTLAGGSGNDVLVGGAGKDTMLGGSGKDEITGGAGKDKMTGGAGDDDFNFKAVGETGKSSGTRDVITDFKHGHDDIDLSAIDANGKASGNGKFTFLSHKGDAFTGHKGEVHWFHQGSKTIVEGDIDGNKHADFQIELTGKLTLTKGDFFL